MQLLRVAVFTLGVLTGSAALAADVALPTDVTITPPSPDLKPEIAAFSGRWMGVWAGTLDAALVVEKIDARSARVVYAWGDAPR